MSDFANNAPALHKALVAELTGLIARAPTLSDDEVAVLLHVTAYAGYSAEDRLFLPAFAVLWGGEVSYVPPVRLPETRTRAAVSTLRRRGLLRVADHGDGVVLETSALRALAPAPVKRRHSPSRKRK